MLNEKSIITKPTVLSLFQTIPSGIAFDIAKNHTGICIWDGVDIKRFGFALSEFDKTDYFSYYKMRRELKQKIVEIVKGGYFEFCIVEDIYGGENFDTVRKLAELNTVPDEIIFDRTMVVNNFVRWKPSEWMAKTRTLYKQRGKLKSKIETHGILEYLEDDFVLSNKDKSKSEKDSIFYEDICDATAMLLGVVAQKNADLSLAKSSSVKLSDIKMVYVDDILDSYGSSDSRVSSEGFIEVDLDYRNIEKSLVKYASTYPNDVLCAMLPSSKLGNFGLKHKFEFFDSEESYLFFYNKRGG